jgi:hypothetical protein
VLQEHQIAVFRRSFLHASEREKTPSLTHRATSPSRSASPITPKPTFSQVGWVEERGCQVCCQESCPNQRDGDCAAGAPGVAVSSLTRRATASQHTPLGPVSAPSGCPSTSQPPLYCCAVGKCRLAGAIQLWLPGGSDNRLGLYICRDYIYTLHPTPHLHHTYTRPTLRSRSKANT